MYAKYIPTTPQKTFYTIVLKNFPELAKQLPSLEKRLSGKEAIR